MARGRARTLYGGVVLLDEDVLAEADGEGRLADPSGYMGRHVSGE